MDAGAHDIDARPPSTLQAAWPERLRAFLSQHRYVRDALVIFTISIAVFIYAASTDLFEKFHEIAVEHEEWQIDEIFVLFVVLAVGGLAFAVRRVQDLRLEVKARYAAERRAHDLARHDPLTGLPNRRFFGEKLRDAIDRTLTDGGRCAILMLDLDGFKNVNDIHGHDFGDRTLMEFAEHVQVLLRPDTMLARLGGDEFAILQPIQTSEDSLRLARRIIASVSDNFTVGESMLLLGCGIGIVVMPDDGTDPADLIRRADVALYRAKSEGRSSIRFFERGMDALVDRRSRLEQELCAAVAEHAIVPCYQPLIDLEAGRIVAFEALARWQSPTFGQVAPTEFITIAEECGVIHELGDQLLRHACTDAVKWPADITLAFNVSAVQLHNRSFGLQVMKTLAETGFSPRRLELEITENALVRNVEIAQRTIDDLRAAGVRIALDDFGTGYATLTQLLSLHLDKIKIDHSFIARLDKDNDSAVVVRAILGLASGFGLVTTAEGVETKEQFAYLKANGCTQGQGFLFSKAILADDVPTFLSHFQERSAVA